MRQRIVAETSDCRGRRQRLRCWRGRNTAGTKATRDLGNAAACYSVCGETQVGLFVGRIVVRPLLQYQDMRFWERYRRLTLWNKIGVLGAMASFAGVVIALWMIMKPDGLTAIGEQLSLALDRVTGGESFAYVVPQPHDGDGNVPLAIRSVGQNPLTGVKVTIRDISLGAPLGQLGRVVDVGVMSRDTIRLLEGTYLKASTVPGDRVYKIEISALNGIFDEVIALRTSSADGANCLADNVVVTKRRTIAEVGPTPPKVLINQDWHRYVPCAGAK